MPTILLIEMRVPVLYTSLALTRMQMPTKTKSSKKQRTLQRVQLTISLTRSDLRTLLSPVSGFCSLEHICIIRVTKELSGQKR